MASQRDRLIAAFMAMAQQVDNAQDDAESIPDDDEQTPDEGPNADETANANDDDDDESDPDEEPELDIEFRTAGFRIWVSVDGVPLPTYDDPYYGDDDGEQKEDDLTRGIIKKYVECVPGTYPIVEYVYEEGVFPHAVPKRGPTMRLEFWVDGKRMDRHIDNFKYAHGGWPNCRSSFEGKSIGRLKGKNVAFGRKASVIQKLKFVPTVLDEERKKGQFDGKFEIRVWRCSTSRGKSAKVTAKDQSIQQRILHEKQTKGKAIHTVAETRPQPAIGGETADNALFAPRVVVRYDKGDTESKPLATYVFLYRTREALEQLHIVESTPTPSPEPETQLDARDIFGMTEDELRNELMLARRLLKRERVDDDDDDGLFVREDDPEVEYLETRPKEKKRFHIDLSDDSDEEVIMIGD